MDVLVCALATAAMTAANSSFDRHCSRCGERVVIAPSGQRLLRERSMKILCLSCAVRMAEELPEGGEVTIQPAPGALDDLADVAPNMWRKRN